MHACAAAQRSARLRACTGLCCGLQLCKAIKSAPDLKSQDLPSAPRYVTLISQNGSGTWLWISLRFQNTIQSLTKYVVKQHIQQQPRRPCML
jgi:hypothetical protein